jgi:Tol biopolymer transport system component
MGSGNIYVTDSHGAPLLPILPPGELGYLMDASWSWGGEQLAAWSSQNNSIVYLIQADGSNLIQKPLGVQIFSTPRFDPQDGSIIFYGADAVSSGLFAIALDNLQTRTISYLVEDEGGYAYSHDGSRLAFIEMDRERGEARLVIEESSTRDRTVLGGLPIPKGSGSSIPEVANLSWSSDSAFLIFDFGRNAADRAIYLAPADGSGILKVVDTAYAPTISPDGKCLAYISEGKVFLRELAAIFSTTATPPVFLADLPTGRGSSNSKQDKLQWSPKTLR